MLCPIVTISRQQNNKGGFQDFLPPSPSPPAFSQVFFLVFMKCLDSKAIKMHFRMEQLPLTLLRFAEIAPALRLRPSLSLMPAFPCAGFCFVCALSSPCTNMLVQCPLFPYSLPCKQWPDGHTCTCAFVPPHTRLCSPSTPQITNANAFTVIFTKACFATAEAHRKLESLQQGERAFAVAGDPLSFPSRKTPRRNELN